MSARRLLFYNSSVKPENYLAMVHAGLKYGGYPLDMEALCAD